LDDLALSRISPRVRVRDSVSIVYRIAPGGYSWIWPMICHNYPNFRVWDGIWGISPGAANAAPDF